MDIQNIYEATHKLSGSQVHIICGLGLDKQPKVSSIKMLSGNVIPLNGVRDALNHFKEEHESHEEPNQTA